MTQDGASGRTFVWRVTWVAVVIPASLAAAGFVLNVGAFLSDGFETATSAHTLKGIKALYTAAAVTGIVLPAVALAVVARTRQTGPILLNAAMLVCTAGLIARALFQVTP